jgi:hypothetical protein
VVALIGVANWGINEAHYRGNRYHTKVAGKTRQALERAITSWSVDKPSQIRSSVLKDLKWENTSVGEKVHRALTFVPVGLVVLGAAVVVFLKAL